MSAKLPVLLAVFGAVATLSAQRVDVNGAGEKEIVVTERGPHHRVIERMVRELQPDGTVKERKSSYTELATGLHYLKDGQWLESKEEIEIFNGAAVARQGQHQVIFAANLNSPGAIDLLAADGKRFRSHVLGLIYTDYASGKSVMIAEIKDSIGELTVPNQVTYPDAFDGDCVADVRYTYTKGGFEQDIILRTAPPSPAEWGLDPETTRLEVFTEFIEAPAAQITAVTLKREENELARQSMKEPDLIDQRLDFGGLHIGQGQAFPLGATPDPFSESSVPTGKSLEQVEGRRILIEKVDYPAVREHLGRLPKSASLDRSRKVGLPDPGRTMLARLLPARPTGDAGKWTRTLQASVSPARAGFVLDYVAILSSSLTNYTFKGDTTYFITNSATVNFYGTTVIEGGTVVKTATNAYLYYNGPIDCRTDPYRPATFTCKDDNTVGETIVGSTGNPLGYSAQQPLGIKDTTVTYDLHHIKVRHSNYGANIYNNVKANFSHVQFINCYRGGAWLSGATVTWRNFLFSEMAYAFNANAAGTNRAEHGTIHRAYYLISATNSGRLLTLTNSILAAVTNIYAYEGANNYINADPTGLFQTVGAAAFYLSSSSTNRDAGTTNINADLRTALAKKTTYPPVILGNGTFYTNSLTLYMQAQRDADIPDRGYHYDPLDYVFSGLLLTNASITAKAGVAIGARTLGNTALGLLNGSAFYSEGTPDNLNRFVRYNTVQEQSNTNWTEFASGAYGIATAWTPAATAPILKLRFTEFSVPASSPSSHYHLYGFSEDTGSHVIRDCQFHGGEVYSSSPTLIVTNSLFNRTHLALEEAADMNPTFRNCTFVGGNVTLIQASTTTWTFKDNLFDGSTNYMEGTITHNYNGYTTNVTRLTPTGANDVVLTVTNLTYEKGWLGRFYVPTNVTSHSPIFNTGSLNATNAGLYHYTMLTNQTRELTTTNDLGFHYVAVNSSGVPIDTDGDGLANYLEDVNGNGLVDSGELSWQSTDTDGDGVNDYVEFMIGRSGTVSGTTNDVSNAVKLLLFTPLK